jgi:hypothetical protein
VPWDFLRAAVQRGTAVAIVLDRVPPGAEEEVADHLESMLADQGLGNSPLFVVPETHTDEGLLPPDAVEPITTWLHTLATDAASRTAVVHHTLDGAVASMSPRVRALAAVADGQVEAWQQLKKAVDGAYDSATARIDEASSDGSLLRGEVMARWQEFVGTGELMRALESKISWLRDRMTAAMKGRAAPGAELAEALETGVEALVRSAADEAAQRTSDAWAADPAGRGLLRGQGDLRRSSPELAERTERAVREWQGFVLDLVREQGQGKRRTARYLAFGVNGLGLLLMIVVFAHTGGLVAGEVAVAGGASALSQKILEAVLGDQAVRSLTAQARADLHRRVTELLTPERARFTARLATADVEPSAGEVLKSLATAIETARAGRR